MRCLYLPIPLEQFQETRTDFVQAEVGSGHEVQQDGLATQLADRYIVRDTQMVRQSQGVFP